MLDGEVSLALPPKITAVSEAAPAAAEVNDEDEGKKRRSQLRRNTFVRRKNLTEEEVMALIGTLTIKKSLLK
jgi:hypothetical protein